MTALYRQFRALNRRACLGKGMSDNVALSEILATPWKSGKIFAFDRRTAFRGVGFSGPISY
jgi:hypothetical protein